MFEPVRADLEAVEREFARQVQSQVHVIPEIGNYILKSGGKRVRPAVLLMARAPVRLYRPARDPQRRRGRVHPHRHAGARRHHRRCRRAARAEGGALAVGQRRHGAGRRLPLHQVDGDGAHAGHARYRPAAVRRHAADDRRRALSAHQERRRRHLSEDEHFEIIRRKTAYLFGGCAQIGGMLGEVGAETRAGAARVRLQPRRRCSSWWTTCSTSPASAEALGKPIGGDLREGKITLPIIHLLQHGGARGRRR